MSTIKEDKERDDVVFKDANGEEFDLLTFLKD